MPTPRFTITYQITLDDKVAASISPSMEHVHPWRTMTLRLVF